MKTSFEKIEKSCESTPFIHVEFKGGNVRLWWSKKAGTYGNQVHAFGVIYEEDKKVFYKTNGCGFSKPCAALDAVFTGLGIKPKGMDLGAEEIPFRYKLGGNLYKVTEMVEA